VGNAKLCWQHTTQVIEKITQTKSFDWTNFLNQNLAEEDSDLDDLDYELKIDKNGKPLIRKRYVFERNKVKHPTDRHNDMCFRLTKRMKHMLRVHAVVIDESHQNRIRIMMQSRNIVASDISLIPFDFNIFPKNSNIFQTCKQLHAIYPDKDMVLDTWGINSLLQETYHNRKPIVFPVEIPGHVFLMIYWYDQNALEVFDPSGIENYQFEIADMIGNRVIKPYLSSMGIRNSGEYKNISIIITSRNLQGKEYKYKGPLLSQKPSDNYEIDDSFCQTWIWWYAMLRFVVKCNVIESLNYMENIWPVEKRHTIIANFWTTVANSEDIPSIGFKCSAMSIKENTAELLETYRFERKKR
jgi:hypothetical protein